ncbi:MAG: OsmC family protein [Anaerolineaceae bacterium]
MELKNVSVDVSQLEGFKIETRTRGHIAMVDQPENSGGTDTGPTPLEYLFVSLGSCIVSIALIVARQQRLPIRKIDAHVEGDLDTDVFMGKRKDFRAGFTGIRVSVSIDGDLNQEEKERFLQEVEARCPVTENLRNLTPVEVSVA